MLVGCSTSSEQENYHEYVDLSSWVGVYEFFDSTYPYQTIGSVQMLWQSITIFNENGYYFADFSRIGWQTWQRFTTKVVGNSDEVNFLFYHLLVLDSERPQFTQWGSWYEDVVMITFRRDNSDIITEWGAIGPILIANRVPGVYFEYVGEVPDDHFVGRYKQPTMIGEN